MQLRFHRRDEQLLSPILVALTAFFAASLIAVMVRGQLLPLSLTLTIYSAIVASPSMLEGPWWDRADAWYLNRAPHIIHALDASKSLGTRLARWFRLTGLLIAAVVIVPLLAAAHGGPPLLALPAVAVAKLGPVAISSCVGALVLSIVAWATVPLRHKRPDVEEWVQTPVLCCADVAAGLRRRSRGDIALALLAAAAILAGCPAL